MMEYLFCNIIVHIWNSFGFAIRNSDDTEYEWWVLNPLVGGTLYGTNWEMDTNNLMQSQDSKGH